MSAASSPYHDSEVISSTYDGSFSGIATPATVGSLDSTLLGSGVALQEPYEVDFPGQYYSNAPEHGSIPSFQPAVNYFTPISESDFSEVLTPTSLHPGMEFSPSTTVSDRHLSPHPTSMDIQRPRSSPIFSHGLHLSPEPERQKTDGLGIIEPHIQLTPASSPRPHHSHSLSIPDTPVSVPRSTYSRYTPIAPNPRQMSTHKRAMSDEDFEGASPQPSKKRRSTPSISVGSATPSIEISDEDSFLLRLKDEESLTWREIALRFQTDMGKQYQIPALQMRLKRLRERMRQWTEMDVQALRMAHEFWASNKFEIIATKMAEFGATEKWTPKQCNKKWQDISYSPEHFYGPHLIRTPTFATSYTSSPIEGPTANFFPYAITTS